MIWIYVLGGLATWACGVKCVMWCNRDLVPENAAWNRAQLRRRIEWEQKLLDDEARQTLINDARSKQQRVEVFIPPDAAPGEEYVFEAPNGAQFKVTVGPAAMPGQTIDVQAPVAIALDPLEAAWAGQASAAEQSVEVVDSVESVDLPQQPQRGQSEATEPQAAKPEREAQFGGAQETKLEAPQLELGPGTVIDSSVELGSE